MSKRPFDPNDLDQPSPEADRAISELEGYAATSATDAPRGFADRVMAAVEREPAPRRGLLAWLPVPAASGGLGQFVRIGAVAATIVLAVAGALFAGQLADIVRNVGSGSPTPVESVSPSPSQPASSAPSVSAQSTASAAASPSGQSPSPTATAHGSPVPTAEDTSEESKTPRPSATVTASPSATPTGPGG